MPIASKTLSYMAVLFLAATWSITGCKKYSAHDEEALDASAVTTIQEDATFDHNVDPSGAVAAQEFEFRASSSKQARLAGRPPLEIHHLLVPDDVQPLMQSSTLEVSPLLGQAFSSTYNALRIHKKNTPDYGVGLQVWTFETTEDARKRFESLKRQTLNIQDAPIRENKLTNSIFAQRASIRSVTFLLDERPAVISLTCASEICRKWELMIELGEKVHERLLVF